MAGSVARRIVVLRHGETVDNAAGVWQGHHDTELSPRGVEQARFAARELAAWSPTLVVSSDLRRAAVTAGYVAASAGVGLRTDPRLREIDVGVWQGRAGVEVREEYAEVFAAMKAGEPVRWGLRGETVAEVGVRVRSALDDVVVGLGPGQTAVVVCHGVAGRACVAALLDLDQRLASGLFGGLTNGHWAVLAESPGGWRRSPWVLHAWNVGALHEA